MTRRKRTPAGKRWVPLTDVEKPFDQTNGVVGFDPGPDAEQDSSTQDLLGKGVAANAVNVGFFGGGGV